MTCDEFRRISLINPFVSTNAENEAHEQHWGKCMSCRKWQDALVEEKLKTITPDELLFRQLIGLVKTIQHEHAVANDPELLESRKKQP